MRTQDMGWHPIGFAPPTPKKKKENKKEKKMPVRTRANPRTLPADVWFIPSFPPWAKGKPPSSFRPNLHGTDLNEFNPSGNQWNPLMRKQANLRIPMPSRKSERQNAKYTSMRDFSVPQHPESCPTATEADLCSCLFLFYTWIAHGSDQAERQAFGTCPTSFPQRSKLKPKDY